MAPSRNTKQPAKGTATMAGKTDVAPGKAAVSRSKANAVPGGVAVPRTIAEEIKQTKPFVSPQAKAVVNLLFTYGWVTERFRDIMSPFGLTIQQYNVLRILRGAGGPMSTNAIRDRMLDRMSDTSRLVDRLEKKKLVRKSTCPADKRLVDVVITPEGQERLLQMDQLEPGLSAVSQALSAEQAEQLSHLLDCLRHADVAS